MTFSRRTLLASAAASLGLAGLGMPRLGRAASSGAKHLIVVKALGGWDVSYCLDPKLGLPDVDGPELDEDPLEPLDREAIQTFDGIPVMVNGFKRPSVTGFFDRWGDRTRVLNGLWVGSIAHDPCRVRMLTGTRTAVSPDTVAITASTLGRQRPIPYMDLSGSGFYGELAALTGQTGFTNQLKFLLDRTQRLPGDGVVYPQFLTRPDDDTAVAAWLRSREDAHVDRRVRSARSVARMDDWFEAQTRAAALRAEGDAFAASLDRGRSVSFDRQVQLAVQLIEGGLSHSVGIDTGRSWDTHQRNSDQHALFEELFAGLDSLMTLLDAAGLGDDTQIVVLSEMTRTPKLNSDAGKDHWPSTSAMLIGGDIRQGAVLGGTNDLLEALPVDLVTGTVDVAGTLPRYDHFAAGLLGALGVDSEPWFGDLPAYGGLVA